MKPLQIVATLSVVALLCLCPYIGESAERGTKRSRKSRTTTVTDSVSTSAYQKFLRTCNSTRHGLMSVHLNSENKCMLEIPAQLLNKPMMMSSKVSESSNPTVAMAGTMIGDPKLIQFTLDHTFVVLRHIVSNTVMDHSQPEINKAVVRNHITPAAHQFKIIHRSPHDSSYVVDVTDFMCASSDGMGIESDMMSVMMGAPKISANQSLCQVIGAKAFEKNVNIKVRLCYKDSKDTPVEATVTRSLILLPETPMKGRKLDDRMNYFSTEKILYTDDKDRSTKFSYINRWNIQPRAEDRQRYLTGELVEPEKPIVYYVDNAFPERWRTYIKQGIEDWQRCFEAIGFKNAIVARDFPQNDPEFDPDDIRYSCFRYITSPISNAMGPSWVDPRSGEIIQGTVYFYHNVVQLIHNWMFTQTAAAFPATREKTFDAEVMGRAIRYIAAHEIGHTLGLMHNMKASAAYPVDSLRSRTFTNRYGTTASIMDYARFNYVAQPGDGVEMFYPPLIGAYDLFSVKVGYKPIVESDETSVIKQWFNEVAGQESYVYGPQSMGQPIDPSAQSEDLGDDPIKASEYGIKNSKYILTHLLEWGREKGYELSEIEGLYAQLREQYLNYIGHVMTMIGGVNLYPADLSENKPAYVPVAKARQKQAVLFILNEINRLPQWIENREILTLFKPQGEFSAEMQLSMMQGLMTASEKIDKNSFQCDNAYTSAELFEDLFSYFWSDKRASNTNQRYLEYCYVKMILNQLGLSNRGVGSAQKSLTENMGAVSSIPAERESQSRFGIKQLYFGQLLKIKQIAKKRMISPVKEIANHYHYLYYELSKVI